MNRQIIIISVLVLLLGGCTQTEQTTVVSWKTSSPPTDTLIYVDKISEGSYNFKELRFILFVDSLVKEALTNGEKAKKNLELSGYEISLSDETFLDGVDFKLCNIYHQDWPFNQRFIFNQKTGMVGFFPSHSRKEHYLLFKAESSDTTYKLTDELLTFFQKDTTLNPLPPPMPIDIPVIEVEDEIEIDEDKLESAKTN